MIKNLSGNLVQAIPNLFLLFTEYDRDVVYTADPLLITSSAGEELHAPHHPNNHSHIVNGNVMAIINHH